MNLKSDISGLDIDTLNRTFNAATSLYKLKLYVEITGPQTRNLTS